MLRPSSIGKMDHVLIFYAPSVSKDSIGDTINTLASQGSTRGERIWRSSGESFEGNQQVGNTMQDFRIHDRMFSVTQEWEFDVYSISDPATTTRYKVRGVKKEGRGNTVLITGETRDNG